MSRDREARLATLDSCRDVDELLDLGCELAEDDRPEEAERCFRRAANLGSAVGAFNLGNTLVSQERWTEAVSAYEQALAGGETDAWLNLGLVLVDKGDDDGAMRAFREAAEAGDSDGAVQLAFSLREQGQQAEALTWVRDAAAAGNDMAGGVVACWEWDRTHDLSLEPALRAGADHYDSARVDLAALLRSTGRIAEARDVLEWGAELGESQSMLPLGNLLLDEFGHGGAAEASYRRGIAAGDIHSHHNLGLLLRNRGLVTEAAEHFRLGVAAGDAKAAEALRELPDQPH